VLEPLSGYLWLGARLLAAQPGLEGEAFNFGPDAHVDQTVQQLLEIMAKRWPGVAWHVAEGSRPSEHEARLLKLSCDKALFHLGWRAVLPFNETAELTADWYRSWHEGNAHMDDYSREQIQAYCARAGQRGLVWAKACS
jgi:CDP-glucose 4,6-dehydratase